MSAATVSRVSLPGQRDRRTMSGMTVGHRERAALRFVVEYLRREGVAPTRATADREGHSVAISALARLGLVREPSTGLGRVELTERGRQAVSD